MSTSQVELAEKLQQFLADPAARQNPYPFYKEMRENDPVHRAADGTWWVTNYEGCLSLTRDRRWTHQNPLTEGDQTQAGLARRMVGRMVLFRDPPDHTRLRSLLGRVFMRPHAEKKRDDFRAHIDRVLDEAAARGTVDFREEIARLIPVYMICDVIGLPQRRYENLIDWSNRYASMLSNNVTPELEAWADAGFSEFIAYLAPILQERRQSPQEDLLTEWIAAEDSGKLLANEIASYSLFTLTGGQMTTTLLMTNALYTLKKHPDQWAKFRADTSLKASLIEEVLRFESSGRAFVPRWAKEDMELCGKTIPKGEMVIGLESAANRDPKVFPDPETFDITRGENRHLAFGGGLHVCPGQFVARVEAQELMAAIAERFPDIEVGEPNQWIPDWIVRGLDRLPVKLRKDGPESLAA